MKKQLFFIFASTVALQFFIIKTKNTSMILTRPLFLVTNPRTNYSEIYPMFPMSGAFEYNTVRYSKTTVRLIRTGSKITHTGKINIGRKSYNTYKLDGETLLLKSYLANKIFNNNYESDSLPYAIENNQNLIEQIIRNKEIDTQICFQKENYGNDPTFYLKEMLKEYNLEKDVLYNYAKEVTYARESFTCINSRIKNAKTYFFVSQFISNERDY